MTHYIAYLVCFHGVLLFAVSCQRIDFLRAARISAGRSVDKFVSEYIDHVSTNELGLNNERLI